MSNHSAILLFSRCLVFLLLLVQVPAHCAPGDSVPPVPRRLLVSGIPVIFYTPETRFAFGATGLAYFNFKSDSLHAHPSNFSLSFICTQNRQVLLSLPFNLFLANRSYHLYGEMTYNRFSYNFYGVGNSEPQGYVERYGVKFPRLRITALKRISRYFFAGPRYAFDDFVLFDLAEGGKLISGQVPGSSGGRVSGLGAVFIFDSRDNVFFPSRGMWGELVIYRDDRRTGSSFNYTRVAIDFSKFFSFGKNIIGVNLYSMFSDVQMPFFQMASLGGMKRMRGYYEGRYRDNNGVVLQAEFRRPLIWLLGFTLFGSAGQVAQDFSRFSGRYWRFTYGAGLRLMMDEKQKINLRFDLAIGNGQLLPYFTVGEAF